MPLRFRGRPTVTSAGADRRQGQKLPSFSVRVTLAVTPSFLENPAEYEGPQIAGDDEDVLAVLQVGSDAAGDLLVAVGGDVDKNGLSAMNGLSGVRSGLGRTACAPNFAPELNKTQFLHRIQLFAETRVIVKSNLKAAHGHDGGDGVSGGTGANDSDMFNHGVSPYVLALPPAVAPADSGKDIHPDSHTSIL